MADKNEDNVDLINYKGIYFDDDSGQKFQCPETGAHFEYLDMFRRLKRILTQREKLDLKDQTDTQHKVESPKKDENKKIVKTEDGKIQMFNVDNSIRPLDPRQQSF